MSNESTISVRTAKAPDSRRFVLWELGGGALMLLIMFLLIMVGAGILSGHKKEIEEAKALAEANRPVDAVNVALITLKPQKVTDKIVLPGLLQAWLTADISAQVSGEIVSKAQDGAKVKKGDSLLHIEPKDYQIKLNDTKSAFEKAEQALQRKTKLRNNQINTQSELEEATADYNKAKSDYDAARLALERCNITAPYDGVVDTVLPDVGEYVSAGTKVAKMAQLGELKAEVGIPEKDIDLVRNVQSCEVRVDAAAGKTVVGERVFLSYLPAEGAQVYTLRLKVPNQDGSLRPGMFGNVEVIREVRQNILVPIYAVMVKDDQHYVFVADKYTPQPGKENDPRTLQTARKKPVKLGVLQGAEVEIVSGLEPGERLVAVGQRNLDDGSVMSVVKSAESISDLQQ